LKLSSKNGEQAWKSSRLFIGGRERVLAVQRRVGKGVSNKERKEKEPDSVEAIPSGQREFMGFLPLAEGGLSGRPDVGVKPLHERGQRLCGGTVELTLPL